MKGKWLFVALCAFVFTQERSLAQENVTYTITDPLIFLPTPSKIQRDCE